MKDLGTGVTVKRNATTTMHAASTMKTAVLLEALRRVDEGTLSLSTGVPVVDCFTSIVDGSPFRVELGAGERRPASPRTSGSTRASTSWRAR